MIDSIGCTLHFWYDKRTGNSIEFTDKLEDCQFSSDDMTITIPYPTHKAFSSVYKHEQRHAMHYEWFKRRHTLIQYIFLFLFYASFSDFYYPPFGQLYEIFTDIHARTFSSLRYKENWFFLYWSIQNTIFLILEPFYFIGFWFGYFIVAIIFVRS
jgi:hypothetical protein